MDVVWYSGQVILLGSGAAWQVTNHAALTTEGTN